MKNKFIIFVIILAILLITLFTYLHFTKNKYSENFSLRLSTDESSSGASRYYEMNVNYKNDSVVFANRTEVIDDTLGNHLRCVEQFDPKTGVWERIIKENYPDNRTCASVLKMYSSKEKIDKAIRSGEIVNNSEGCHRVICYEITTN